MRNTGDIIQHARACWFSHWTFPERVHSLRCVSGYFLKEKGHSRDELSGVFVKTHSSVGKDGLVSQMCAHMKSFVVTFFIGQIINGSDAHPTTLRGTISIFPNINLSVKMGKYVVVISSLITELNQSFLRFLFYRERHAET